MVVCTDDMALQLMLLVLIIDHFALVHQCFDACNETLGVLSWAWLCNILKFSKVHMSVDIMCLIPCCILSRKAEAFALVTLHSSSLPVGIHCTCISRDLVPRGCKDVSEVVLTVRHDAVEEEPVLQGMPKDGERVVCIFWVPVIDGQADGCGSSCQHTGNGIRCGLGRLSDELLWGWFCGHVSDPGWSDNGQIWKDKGDRTQKWLYLRNCWSDWAQTWTECS